MLRENIVARFDVLIVKWSTSVGERGGEDSCKI